LDREILSEVAARATEESGWARLNSHYLRQLKKEIDLPRIELPFLFSEEFGEGDLERLIEIVDAGPLAKQRGHG
jgi:hypothetical protein